MKSIFAVLAFGLMLLGFSATVPAHQVQSGPGTHHAGFGHSHVYKRSGYGGGIVQGHAVNNAYGNIVIWSPRATNNYGTANPGLRRPPVQYKFPNNPSYGREYRQEYGKVSKKAYGK